jgi:NADH:ubiquinone oxidoreductase subunit 6 (subunit J)
MTFRHILILLCIVGVSASFMPWLHYPKPNAVVYGYMSDGIVTGFIFLLFLVVFLYNIKKATFNNFGSGLMALISLWMGYEAYTKINDIELEKLNFSTDNPIIALSTAGFDQGIGIYIMGMTSIALFVTIITALILQTFSPKYIKNQETKVSLDTKKLVILVVILGIIAILCYFFTLIKFENKLDKTELKNVISNSVVAMGKAIQTEDYNAFVNFNHPIMIQSYGGKERTKALLSATLQELKKSGYKVKNTELSQVHDVQYIQNNIQAIISQKLTLDSMNLDKIQIQKMIAISENNGISWSFINIDGKSREEIKSVFPLINPKLKF